MTTLAALVSRVMGDFFGANQNGPGNPLSNRNYIVDGNFDSWIGGSVTTAVGTPTNGAATMYYANPGTAGVATVTQQAFPPGSPLIGMTTPVRYYFRWAQTTASTGNPIMSHRIESATTLESRSATFSCWLRSIAGNLTITGIGWNQAVGTGGSPSGGSAVTVPVTWNLTNLWQRFSVRLDIASMTGAVFGTNNNDSLNLQLVFPPSATFTVDTAQWQLEQTSARAPAAGIPTTFEYRGQQAELARVQRYYEILTGGFYTLTTLISGTVAYGLARIIPKRAVPACTVTAGSTFTHSTPTGNYTPSSVTAVQASSSSVSITVNGTGWTAAQPGVLQDAGGSSIICDARL
jgi:hypothetical protein